MDEKSRTDFLHGMAKELKDQADKARRELELYKADCEKQLEPIELKIKELQSHKLVESSKFEAEMKEKEQYANQMQKRYTHFAVAIGVSRPHLRTAVQNSWCTRCEEFFYSHSITLDHGYR
jgi:hypothetical protein